MCRPGHVAVLDDPPLPARRRGLADRWGQRGLRAPLGTLRGVDHRRVDGPERGRHSARRLDPPLLVASAPVRRRHLRELPRRRGCRPRARRLRRRQVCAPGSGQGCVRSDEPVPAQPQRGALVMTRALVTGATGTIGSHVVALLRERGVPVRAFVRDSARARALLGADVELAVGDFDAPATVRAALDGISDLFLLTANHPRQLEHEVAVIDGAAGACARVLKLSAIGAAAGSPLPFWDCHGRSEVHLHGAGTAAVILRAGFYMSNTLAAADSVRGAGSIFAPAAGVRIAMIDPRDVAAAAAALLAEGGHEGDTITVTGPAAITYDDVAEALSAVTGRSVAFVPVPDEAALAGLVDAGMPEWLAGNLVRLFGLLRAGAAAETSDGVRAITGAEPRSLGRLDATTRPRSGASPRWP